MWSCPAGLAAPLAFLVAAMGIAGMLRSGMAKVAMDAPNQRSLHGAPMPRTGGLAVMAGVVAGSCLASPQWLLIALALSLAVVSFLDDKYGLSAATRLLTHLGAATALTLGGLPSQPLWLVVIAVLAIVWMTNLYNFMDGADGLAGGMALFGFAGYGIAAASAGDPQLAVTAFTIAAAAAGFLIFNFHPARIFMGDSGSVPLGFFAGGIGLLGWRREAWPWWFPLLVFSPFVVDATVTLLKRVLRGERVWEAHRDHYYQRLVRTGLGHRKTALLEYAAMATAGASALWGLHCSVATQAALLLTWAAAYIAAMWLVDRRWRSFADERGGGPTTKSADP